MKYVKTLLADTDIPADVKLRLKKRLRRLKKRWNKHGNPPVVNLKGSKGRLLKADMDFNSVSPRRFFLTHKYLRSAASSRGIWGRCCANSWRRPITNTMPETTMVKTTAKIKAKGAEAL